MLTDHQLNIAVEQLCSSRMQNPEQVIGEHGKTHGSVARAEILAALQVQAAIDYASQQSNPSALTNSMMRSHTQLCECNTCRNMRANARRGQSIGSGVL